jgi:hypothetical protein
MDVCAPLIANFQAPKATQPGQRVIDHPAILPQALAGFDAFARHTRRDASATAGVAALGIVIPFVGMQLLGPLARASALASYRRNGIQGRFEYLAAVDIGCRNDHGQREAVPFDHKMTLRPRFATIRRVGSARFAPRGTGMLTESSEARDQSSRPASLKRWSKVWCNRSWTPACCQSHSLVPGAAFPREMLLLRTKMMPVKAARLDRRGRPPLGLGGFGGRSGSMIAHRSSLTNGLLIPPFSCMSARFC